jgi:hypothetical protein
VRCGFGRIESTLEGSRQTLFTNLWRSGDTNQLVDVPTPQAGESASAWWRRAEPAVANIRATGFDRYKLAAFKDLYGVETIYGATLLHRAVIAELLAEKVHRGDLHETDALRIGRQILRDNALALYPTLKDKLWKHRATLTPAGLVPKP